MKTQKEIIGYFETGKNPTSQQFKDSWTSHWHKSEKFPITQVVGLRDEIAKATTNFKGYFVSQDELLTEYPQAQNKKGFFAWVGSPYPGTVYKVNVDGGAWTDTGEVPTQQEIDLAGYAKKEDLQPLENDVVEIKETINNIQPEAILKDGDLVKKQGTYLFAGSGEIYADTSGVKVLDESILTINGYLNSTGSVTSNDLYKTSNFIDVDATSFRKIQFYGFASSSGARAVVFFDNAKNIISIVPNINTSFGQLQNADIPTNTKYFRISKNNAQPFVCKLLSDDSNLGIVTNDDELSIVEYDNDELKKTLLFKNPNLLFANTSTKPDQNLKYIAEKGMYPNFSTGGEVHGMEYLTQNGYYVDRKTGKTVSNTVYSCTELIPIEDINKILYTPLPSVTACGIAFYNNDTFISSDSENQDNIIVPSGVTHFRLCGRNDSSYYTIIYRVSFSGSPLEVDALSLVEFSDGLWNATSLGSDSNTSITTTQKASLKDFTVSGTTTVNGIILSAENKTEQKQLLFNVDTYLERISMNVVFTVQSDKLLGITFGKGYSIATVNANTSKIEVKGYSGVLETLDLGFQFLNGYKYVIGFDKVDEENFKLFIYGSNGYFEKTYNKYKTVIERGVAIAWGKPFFGVNNGDVLVSEATITSDYDVDSRVLIAGDSFIEGTSLLGNGDSLNDRWCALMASDIGKMRTVITGKGGEVIDSAFITRFKRELSWFPNIKYVILSLGTNNSNFSAYKTSMSELIAYLKSINIIPVLVTVTPRAGFPIADMNNFVKSSGELYIDMNQAVSVIGNELQWKEGFSMADNIHPTAAKGHKYMYHRSKIDTSKIYA